MSLEQFYPYPVRRISLVGHDCAYIDEGKGIPMVFLHGFSVNLASFAKNYPFFAKRRRVIALDYPGYYLSDKKDAPYDIPFMARAVVELVEKLGIERTVLVGSSMGGAVAIETALSRPDLIGALVLAAPGGFSGRNVVLSWLIGLQLLFMPKETVVAKMYERLPGRVPAFFADKASPFIETIRAGYEEMKKRGDFSLWVLTLAKMARSVLKADLSDRARSVAAPTLIIWGDRDEVLPPAGAPAAKRAMGDRARLVIFNGVGHVPFIEAPDRFNDLVDGFLTSLGL